MRKAGTISRPTRCGTINSTAQRQRPSLVTALRNSSAPTNWAELKLDSQPDRDSRRTPRRTWTLCSRKSSALPATLMNRRGLKTRRPRTPRLRQIRPGAHHHETIRGAARNTPEHGGINAELWQQGRWANSGFARATFHPDRARAEWEFALAEHEWAGDEGILARHGLLLGDGNALFKALRAEGRTVAMIPEQVHSNPWPVLFTAPPLPEGETPKEGHIYT
eukprot:5445507-Pleurochrysis_carterae.AAC.1